MPAKCCRMVGSVGQTWLGSGEGSCGRLLGSCQEFLETGDGHARIHQLSDQLWQLEQGHAQHLQETTSRTAVSQASMNHTCTGRTRAGDHFPSLSC